MRPSSNLKTLSAESDVAQDDNWMLSYIDVFVLITTLFLMLLVLNKANFGSVEQTLSDSKISLPQVEISEVIDLNKNKSEERTDTPQPQHSLHQSLSDAIQAYGMSSHVALIEESNKTRLEIQSRVLFNSGDAYLTRSGVALLENLVPVLNVSEGIIVIEGHTDNEPIQTRRYPSNWSLAAARATEVLSFFVAEGFEETRFRAVSYGETQPIVPNDSLANKRKNRRVSLVIEQGEVK